MDPAAIDAQLAAIQAAFTPDASTDARRAGLDACRSLLSTLQPAPQPPAGAPPTAPAAMPSPGQLEAMIGLLQQARTAGASPDQLISLVLGKVRSLLPEGITRPSSGAFRFPLAPMPRGKTTEAP